MNCIHPIGVFRFNYNVSTIICAYLSREEGPNNAYLPNNDDITESPPGTSVTTPYHSTLKEAKRAASYSDFSSSYNCRRLNLQAVMHRRLPNTKPKVPEKKDFTSSMGGGGDGAGPSAPVLSLRLPSPNPYA